VYICPVFLRGNGRREMLSFSSAASRLSTGLGLAAVVSVSHAIVPDEQLVPKGVLNQVVRVLTDGGNGTGSVIDKKPKMVGGQQVGWYMCILTANHVTKGASEMNVAFNNVGNPNQGPYDAWLVAEGRRKNIGGDRPDLAILGIETPMTNFTNALDPLTVIDDANVSAETRFTVAGFGTTGTLVDLTGDGVSDGYLRQPGTYGNRRAANNRFDQKVQDAWGQWDHKAWKYDLDGPVWDVPNEGWALPGDSGGPLLVRDAVDVEFEPGGRSMSIFTDAIVGVVSRGDTAGPFYPWGDLEYDVRITPAYREWIEMECMAVPEPTTILVLAAGGLLALARRRR
jgi:hypothetical protein